MLEKIDLFEARTEGYTNYRVPAILCTKSGVILASAEARRGGGGDWDSNDILLRRSLDGGISWQPAQLIVSFDQYGPGPISNFVMINDELDGSVHALFCHDYSRVFYIHSEDAGVSFSDPTDITESLLLFKEQYPWRVIATGPGHGIQLQNGRLIVPVWMSDGSSGEFPGHLGHRPSEVATIYSNDGGKTWECGDIFVHTDERVSNPSETLAVELDDGRVLCNIRSESKERRRLIATSPDGARNWTTPQFDDALLEPVCMASLLRLKQKSESGASIFIFVNPDNLENELIPPGGHIAHDRKRLAVKMSTSNCGTWPASRVLEAGPSGYSDLAEAPDGTILCIYECGMLDRMSDTRYLTVARFDLDWLVKE